MHNQLHTTHTTLKRPLQSICDAIQTPRKNLESGGLQSSSAHVPLGQNNQNTYHNNALLKQPRKLPHNNLPKRCLRRPRNAPRHMDNMLALFLPPHIRWHDGHERAPGRGKTVRGGLLTLRAPDCVVHRAEGVSGKRLDDRRNGGDGRLRAVDEVRRAETLQKREMARGRIDDDAREADELEELDG